MHNGGLPRAVGVHPDLLSSVRPPRSICASGRSHLFKLTDKIYFDMSRQILIFGNISLGG
jgi:hypothetical protein